MGDVIYIEANSGAVKRVGRSDAFATEFDLEAEEYVPLPKGEVHKKKEIVQVFYFSMIFAYPKNSPLCDIASKTFRSHWLGCDASRSGCSKC